MKIAILAPSDKTFIKHLLPSIDEDVLPKGYSGAPFIGALIKEFITLGHEVCAITTTEAINDDYEIKEFTGTNFKWIVVPFRPKSIKNNGNKLGRIVDGFAFESKQMIKVIEQEQPDFVHAHWSYEFASAAIKSKFPYLITVHDNPFVILKYFKNIYRFGRLLMAESNLKKVDFATTVSPYMLDYVKSRCSSVEIVPNPIKIKYIKSEIEEFVEQKIKTISAPKIFMINNGWDERKNGKKALEAYKGLQQKIPEATLHLYGSGTEVEGDAYIEAKVLGLDLKSITFNGSVTRDVLMDELETAHLFLHPALEESFGVVLIESMSMGIPVIGGENSGAVPWVINELDLLVDVKDSNLIAESVIRVLTNHELYRKYSLNGYKNVSDRFSSNIVAQSYLNCYERVLKNKKDEHSENK